MTRTSIQRAAPARPTGDAMAKPQNALLSDMELPLRQTFYPLGFAVEIATNHPEVLLAAAESFGHRRLRHGSAALTIHIGVTPDVGLQCPPEPTRRQFNYLYCMVADAENQAVLDLRTGTNFVWLTSRALRKRIYLRTNFLEKVVYLLLGAFVVTDIHAGCVGKRGKAILLCGDSGAGKSTLSYACARAGWTYTSDDTSYLVNGSRVPRVIGHSHRVRFRPTAKELFPELAAHEVTPRMEGKPSIEVPVSELPPIATSAEANIVAIVYLKRSANTRERLSPLAPGVAIQRLSQDLFSAGEVRRRHEQQLAKLDALPAFELHYSLLEDAIAQLERLVS